MRKWIWVYVGCFAALTATDMVSTLWAMSLGNGHEFNAAVASKVGRLDAGRFLGINAGMLAFTAGMLAWAIGERRRIDPRYIDHAYRAAFNVFYINPFSRTIVPKSALHYIALAPTVLMFKAFVSLNNAFIAIGAPDLVTPLARTAQRLGAGPVGAYWLVVALLILPFWLSGLSLAARALRTAPATNGPRLSAP